MSMVIFQTSRSSTIEKSSLNDAPIQVLKRAEAATLQLNAVHLNAAMDALEKRHRHDLHEKNWAPRGPPNKIGLLNGRCSMY